MLFHAIWVVIGIYVIIGSVLTSFNADILFDMFKNCSKSLALFFMVLTIFFWPAMFTR